MRTLKEALPFVLTGSLMLFISSCNKSKEDMMTDTGPCATFETPEAYNNGPVMAGGMLQLSAYTNETGVTFEWTGPGNFISDKQNPVITNIAFDAGGKYILRISNITCTSNAAMTNVIIDPPCTIAANTANFGSGTWNFYSAITCGVSSGGNYLIHAASASGDLDIKFAGTSIPSGNKIYGIDNTQNSTFDSANVQLTLFPFAGDELTGQPGSVYVSNYQGLSAAFCGVLFRSGTTANTFTGTAKIVCQ